MALVHRHHLVAHPSAACVSDSGIVTRTYEVEHPTISYGKTLEDVVMTWHNLEHEA